MIPPICGQGRRLVERGFAAPMDVTGEGPRASTGSAVAGKPYGDWRSTARSAAGLRRNAPEIDVGELRCTASAWKRVHHVRHAAEPRISARGRLVQPPAQQDVDDPVLHGA
jgi:hypothetical protein